MEFGFWTCLKADVEFFAVRYNLLHNLAHLVYLYRIYDEVLGFIVILHLVVEKLNELTLIAEVAKRLGIEPNVGIRIKLSSSGSGKWEESGGDFISFLTHASTSADTESLAYSCIE